MPTPGKKSGPPEPTASDATAKGDELREAPRARSPWRPWVRATHRDVGYVAVGLTLIYAASGLAVNHIAAWDPNFHDYSEVHELGPGLPQDDAQLTRAVLDRLEIRQAPREVYRASEHRFDIQLERRALHVDPVTGHVVDEGQKPRFLLRIANWLHLNRGKKAWTYAADAYAIALLFLALSGLTMIPGKRGFFWRGALMLAIGLAVPAIYVAASGGP